MAETLTVLLNGTVAGSVARHSGGRLRFEYDSEYRSDLRATPLSLSMPLQVPSHPDHTISPWLANLLPDNDGVLNKWARRFHVSASSPFSLLGTQIGEDCAGAVQFVSPDQIDVVLSHRGEVIWLDERGVADRLRQLERDSTAWLGGSFTGQFSLAGAQAKTALVQLDGRWGIPSGSIPTTHIIKPAVAGLDDHDLNEHLCLDAARRVGLIAVRTQVLQFDTVSAVVVERYDRQLRGNAVVRVHQEDICQALGVPPNKKYQNEGGPSPSDITRLLRRVMSPSRADEAISRFADALSWNWLIAGTDAHAKNYSLLLAGSQTRLAPLYDIASALPYDFVHERSLRMAMKVGTDYRIALLRNTWPDAARELGIDADLLISRVRELGKAAPDAFSDAARQPDVVSLNRNLPTNLVDLVANRASRCMRLLESSPKK